MATIGSNFSIASCVANLPAKLGNRQNLGIPIAGGPNATNMNLADGSLAVSAVLEAIKELTETWEFEELKYQTFVPPQTALSLAQGNPIVTIASLLATIATNTNFPLFQALNFIDLTDIYTFWMWFSGGVNQAGRTLKYRRVTTVDSYSYGITSNTQGNLGTAPPVFYTRFGQVLQVGPIPDQAYQFFVRMKLRHPFTAPWAGSSLFTPATLTANLLAGAVNTVAVVDGGTGYQPSVATIPVIFSAPGSTTGTTARGLATTNASGVITSVAVTSGGTLYTSSPTALTATLATQQILTPDSWQEIIELAACRRLALWFGASEYITMFDNEINKKIERTGVMTTQERIAQMVRDEKHNERQLSLRTSIYTYANR